MTFLNPTPLSDVLNYVRLATATSTYPGIPIYLDPIGLQEAEQSPSSTVSIDLRGIPLKTTLRLCLNQRGLDYIVRHGFLHVTSADDSPLAPERISSGRLQPVPGDAREVRPLLGHSRIPS